MTIFSRLASSTPVTASGIVSHLKDVSTTTGSGNANRSTVSTEHETWFRVNGRPAVYEGVSSIAEGDILTIVGRDRGDAIDVVAMRNENTGVETAPIIRTWPMWVLIAVGVPMIPVFGLGLLAILFAVAGFVGNKQNQKMIALLKQTPAKVKSL